MASDTTLYPSAREAFSRAEINWVGSDTFKAMLVRNSTKTFSLMYTKLSDVYSTPTDAPLSDALTGLVSPLGVCNADDAVFTTVNVITLPGDLDYDWWAIVKINPVILGNSLLIVGGETATGLPLVPNGSTVRIIWATEGIFKL